MYSERLMPSALPDGEAGPAGRLAARSRALTGLGSPALRRLRARAVLRHPVRLLRLQHLHRRRARRRRVAGLLRATAVAEVRLARQVLGTADVPAGDRVPRWRHAHPAAAARPGPAARRDPRRARACGPTPRSPPRPTPTASTSARWRRCATPGFTRVSFGMQSAVPHVLATLDRTHDPDRVPQVVGVGPGGGLRGRQPRPDLRHAGGDARTTGGPAWTPHSTRAPTT